MGGALGQRGRDGGEGAGQLGEEGSFDEGGDGPRVGGGGGGVGEGGGGGGLDRRAGGRRLDQRHLEGRMPLQLPHLLERAAGATGLGRLAPVDAEDGQPAQQLRTLPVGVVAEVELQRLRRGRGRQAQAALGPGQVAGQRDHRRVVGDGAEVVAHEKLGGDEP